MQHLETRLERETSQNSLSWSFWKGRGQSNPSVWSLRGYSSFQIIFPGTKH